MTTVCSRWNKKWKVLRLVWKQIFSTVQRLGLTSHELRVTGNQYIGKNTSHGQVPQATLTIRQGNISCDLFWKFMTEISVYIIQTSLHQILRSENPARLVIYKTSQELRMLSSVTINCQITKIVMNSGSQLSEL